MPTLPIRFISSRGPVDSYAVEDLLFFECMPDYANALTKTNQLEELLRAQLSTHEFVIYRMSRFGHELFVWRQRSSPIGNDHHPDEPPTVAPIGYAIYAVPKGLASADPSSPDNPALSQGVVNICGNFGQHGDPTRGGP